MSEWISVESAVPEQGKHVLVFAPDCNIIGSNLVGCYYDDEDCWTVYDFEQAKLMERVTHWMPMPEPPTPT